LISSRLLIKQDKEDMLNGLVSSQMLETAVKCWMKAGMPDYVNGKNEPYVTGGEPVGRKYKGYGNYYCKDK